MDIDALVTEITRRVQEKIDAQMASGSASEEAPDGACKLLVLTSDHGTDCHETLTCPVLAQYYKTECALTMEYQCQVADYEAVIAYTLSNEALGKIANGIFDDGYTRLFGQALLGGKKIFVPAEEVELYQYRQTSPALYYRRLEQNLQLLMDSGVVIAPRADLQDLILNGHAPVCQTAAPSEPEPAAESVKECVICKKVITEKDVTDAHHQKVEVIVVAERAILTDLAKEYASRQRMTIRRQDISSYKGGNGR